MISEKDFIVRPNHSKVKDFLKAEQRKVDQWNNYANKWNINRRGGGSKEILKLKKNPYLTRSGIDFPSIR